jgi:hypothetical protein
MRGGKVTDKTYPTYYGEIGRRYGKADYFEVVVEVFGKYAPLEIKECAATIHFPLSGNLNIFLKALEEEYGEGSIIGIKTSRQGS